jgi:hypothetical protein
MKALLTTNLGTTPLLGRGKVRDLYAVDDALLLVATDRISAFDHVLATGIPGKGKILTQISIFWFDFLSSLVPNHLITANVDEFPASLRPYETSSRGGRCWCAARRCTRWNASREATWPDRAGRNTSRAAPSAEFHCQRICRMHRNCLRPSSPQQRKARAECTTRIFRSPRWRSCSARKSHWNFDN